MPAPQPDYINDKKMYELRESGLSLSEIGKHFEHDGQALTRERVRQRIDRYEEYQIYSEIYGLFDHNTKVVRLLIRNGINNIDKLKKISSEKLKEKKGMGELTLEWVLQVKSSLE